MPASHDLPPPTDLGLPFADTTQDCIAKGLAHIAASMGPQRLRSSYDIDAGAGIEATFKMDEGSNSLGEIQLMPHAVEIIIGEGSKTRTIRATISTEPTGDTEEGEYPKSVVVNHVTDRREVTLDTGTKVARSISIGRNYTRQSLNEKGVATLKTEEFVHVFQPLHAAPKLGGDTLRIPIEDDYGDYSHDAEPNLVIFEQRNGGSWKKTYAFAEQKGAKNVVHRASEVSVFVNREHPDVQILFAPVTDVELRQIDSAVVAAGNLGSVDHSLAELLDKEIEYDREVADRLRPRYAQNKEPGDGVLYGAAEPEEDREK